MKKAARAAFFRRAGLSRFRSSRSPACRRRSRGTASLQARLPSAFPPRCLLPASLWPRRQISPHHALPLLHCLPRAGYHVSAPATYNKSTLSANLPERQGGAERANQRWVVPTGRPHNPSSRSRATRASSSAYAGNPGAATCVRPPGSALPPSRVACSSTAEGRRCVRR